MRDENKIREQLKRELADAQRRITELEAAEARRMAAEKALWDSLRTSADIVQAIPAGLFTYYYKPPDRLVLADANPEAERLTGTTLREWQGKEFNEIWPEARAAGVTQAFLDVMRNGVAFETENLYYADERLEGFFRIRAFPMSGQRLGVAFENITERIRAEQALRMHRDRLEELVRERTVDLRFMNQQLEQEIAERVRAEEALRESERQFRDLYDNAPTAYFAVGTDGRIRRANRQSVALLGYGLDDLIGHPVINLYAETPAGREKAWQVFQRFSAGESTHDEELQMRRADGSLVWISLTVDPVWGADGEIAESRSIVVDITERKRAEEALRASETRLQTIASSAPVVLWALDKHGTFTLSEGRGLEKIDLRPDQVVGQSVFDLYHDHADIIKDVRRALQGETLTVVHQVGAVRFETRLKPIRDEGDQVGGLIGVSVDITERARAEEALRRRNHELALLNRAGQALSSSLDLDQVLVTVLEEVYQMLDVDVCSVWLVDPKTDEMICQQASGSASDIVRGWRLAPGEGLVGWVAANGEKLMVPDAHADSRYSRSVEEATGVALRSIISVPLYASFRACDELGQVDSAQGAKQDVIGVLQIADATVNRFESTDVILAESLAGATAIAIENARLFAEAQQRADEMETLRHISLQITSMLDLPTVLDTIAMSALRLVGATDCHIYLFDEKSKDFHFSTARWENGRREAAVAAPRSAGFTATVAREGRTVVINDAVHHPLYTTPEAREWNLQAIAGFPLKRAGKVVGVFAVAFCKPHTFSEDELRVLSLLADQAVIAIENARLVEGLELEVANRTAEILSEKEKSDAILRNVGDAIVMADLEMQIQYVNDAFARLTGHTTQEILGQHAYSVGAVIESEQARQSMQSTVAEGKVWQGKAIGKRKDGRTYDALLTIAPIRDGEGNLVSYVSSHRDISQQKDLERARSRFITSVSHELRTPVTNINLYTHLLRKRYSTNEAEPYLQALESQADQLTQFIQDVLEITTLDSGDGVATWEPVALRTIIDDAVTTFQSQAEAAGLRLEAQPVPADLPLVKGDMPRLAQVLIELLENAVGFSSAGGRVIIETKTVELEGQPWVTLAVHDTGPGISPEEQERVFDRFFRGSPAKAGHIPGTGLGLSIAQEIVRAHGGRVTVASEVGQGSTFTVWLPSLM